MRTLFGTILVAVIATSATLPALAGSVYDDCVFLFEGGRDGFNGKASDGNVQAGEFVDELHAGVPSHAAHANQEVRGYAENVTWRTIPVAAFQNSGMGTQTVQCLHFEHNYRINGTTTNFFTGSVRPKYVSSVCPTNIYSAVFRVRRDANPYGTESWFMNFGYTANNIATGQGWLLGFANNGYLTTHATGSSAPGQLKDLPTIATNEWVDIGVVVATNEITIHLSKPGKGLYGNSLAQVYVVHRTFLASGGIVPNLTMSVNQIKIGAQEDATAQANVANIGSNAKKVFVGDVQKVAFWPRVLSDSEIREALSGPRPAIMLVGAKNGVADEFGGVAAVSANLDVGHVAQKPWNGYPSELRAGDIWTYSFSVTAADAGLPQILEFTPTASSASGMVRIRVNGSVLTSGKPVEAGKTLSLVVPGCLLVSGANTLVLERADAGNGSVVIDSLWLGGSWQIGRSNNSAGEFAWHSARAYMTDFDTFSWPRAINVATGSSNAYFVVSAPTSVVAKYPYRHTMRIWIQDLTGSPTMGVYLDGEQVPVMIDGAAYDVVPTLTSPTDVSFAVPPGDHLVWLNGVGTKGVWWFDSHRLFFEPPPTGTMMIVR